MCLYRVARAHENKNTKFSSDCKETMQAIGLNANLELGFDSILLQLGLWQGSDRLHTKSCQRGQREGTVESDRSTDRIPFTQHAAMNKIPRREKCLAYVSQLSSARCQEQSAQARINLGKTLRWAIVCKVGQAHRWVACALFEQGESVPSCIDYFDLKTKKCIACALYAPLSNYMPYRLMFQYHIYSFYEYVTNHQAINLTNHTSKKLPPNW